MLTEQISNKESEYKTELAQLIDNQIDERISEYDRQLVNREETKIKELINQTKARKQEFKANLEMKNSEELTKLKNQLDHAFDEKENDINQQQVKVEVLQKDYKKELLKVSKKRKELDKERDEIIAFRKRIEDFETELNALDSAVWNKNSDLVQKEKELLIREQEIIGKEELALKGEDELLLQHKKLLDAEKKLGELSNQVSNKRKSYKEIREKIMNLEKRNQKLKQDLNLREIKLSDKKNLLLARDKVITMAKDLFSTSINDLDSVDDAIPHTEISDELDISSEIPQGLVDKPLDIGSVEKVETEELKEGISKKLSSRLEETKDDITEEPKLKDKKKAKKKKVRSRKAEEIKLDSKLNPKINFDNYKVSDHNRIVYSIAQEIGNGSDSEIKMLYIYGPLGLGKTHLLHAIGNNIQKNGSTKNVMYIPSRDFFSEVNHAIKNKKQKEFTEYFNSINILLLDDFQNIPDSKDSQNLFNLIMDNFLKNQKQMVLTGDRPMENIETLGKNFAKDLLSKSGVTVINLTESGIEILESVAKI